MADGKDKKVKDLPYRGKKLAKGKVAELSVKDLEDLAEKFQGRNPHNKAIDALTIEDLQNLETVFGTIKSDLMIDAEDDGLPGVPTALDPDDWTITCCSCTPCCCCAAAEVDPFASSSTEALSA